MTLLKRILITNDDGIHADGLKVMEAIAAELANEVWVFAPDENCSGQGRALTFTRDLSVNQHGTRRFSCDGTPADCMVLALNHFMAESMPDLVLSGVNMGMNIADDITCSGTIGAAWEAVVHGVPAMALSQKINLSHPAPTPIDAFATTNQEAVPLLKNLIANGWHQDVIININFPALTPKGIRAVQVGRHKDSDEVQTGADDNAFRIGLLRQRRQPTKNDDFAGIMNDYITVTPLALNMTHHDTLNDLSILFNGRAEQYG